MNLLMLGAMFVVFTLAMALPIALMGWLLGISAPAGPRPAVLARRF